MSMTDAVNDPWRPDEPARICGYTTAPGEFCEAAVGHDGPHGRGARVPPAAGPQWSKGSDNAVPCREPQANCLPAPPALDEFMRKQLEEAGHDPEAVPTAEKTAGELRELLEAARAAIPEDEHPKEDTPDNWAWQIRVLGEDRRACYRLRAEAVADLEAARATIRELRAAVGVADGGDLLQCVADLKEEERVQREWGELMESERDAALATIREHEKAAAAGAERERELRRAVGEEGYYRDRADGELRAMREQRDAAIAERGKLLDLCRDARDLMRAISC